MALQLFNFYRFIDLPQYQGLQKPWLELGNELQLKGTILLAPEGINVALSGERDNLLLFIQQMQIDCKTSLDQRLEADISELPFKRFKVRLKKEIIRMNVDSLDPANNAGTYVSAAEWDTILKDPEVVVIDTRNNYETMFGMFKGAVDPEISYFTQFPEWAQQRLNPEKHRKVAMYCTGGIRCEKSTALLKRMGFNEVYHLKGGILRYLEETKNRSGLWEGECYVFDDRAVVRGKVVE